MSRLMTTAQVATAFGLSGSTIRHYRSAGRIRPARTTPGGHARYDLDEVAKALGSTAVDDSVPSRLTGMIRETFAPLGQHDVRPYGGSGGLPAEMAALGSREAAVWPDGSSAGQPGWGGELMKPLRRVRT